MVFLEIQVLWVWDMVVCHWAHGSARYEEMSLGVHLQVHS